MKEVMLLHIVCETYLENKIYVRIYRMDRTSIITQQKDMSSAEKNRSNQARFYAENKDKIAKHKALQRIVKIGSIPQKSKWAGWNLTADIINLKLAEGGHDKRITDDQFVLRARTNAPAPAPAPAKSNSIKDRKAQARANASQSIVSLQEILDAIMAFEEWDEIKTRKPYADRFVRVISWTGADPNNIVPTLQRVDEVVEAVKQGMANHKPRPLSPNSFKDYIGTISTLCLKNKVLPRFCEALGHDVAKAYGRAKQEIQGEHLVNQVENTKEEQDVKWVDIQAGLQVAEEEFPGTQDHLIIALYYQMAIRDDFGNVLLTDTPPPGDSAKNWYDYTTGKLYLNRYKTWKLYSEKVYQLGTKTQQIVLDLITANPGRKYLVEGKNNNTYANGKLTQVIPRAFARAGVDKVSVNVIRHARVAHLWSNPNSTEEQKKALAKHMLHSYATAGLVYQRAKGWEKEDESVQA